MGYLDASYRQLSPEYAAAEYQKIQNILTVCIDPVVKRELTVQKEAITNLTEKSSLQGENLEYLRAENTKLKEQVCAAENWYRTEGVKIQEELEMMKVQMNQYHQMLRPVFERMAEETTLIEMNEPL